MTRERRRTPKARTEEVRAKQQAYYAANRGLRRRYQAEYRKRQRHSFTAAVSVLLSRARTRSRAKGLECDLTTEFLLGKLQASGYKCEQTGIDFIPPGGQAAPWQVSIDRIDPAKGYTQDNVQLVVLMYNLAKHGAADADVVHFARELVRFKA